MFIYALHNKDNGKHMVQQHLNFWPVENVWNLLAKFQITVAISRTIVHKGVLKYDLLCMFYWKPNHFVFSLALKFQWLYAIHCLEVPK